MNSQPEAQWQATMPTYVTHPCSVIFNVVMGPRRRAALERTTVWQMTFLEHENGREIFTDGERHLPWRDFPGRRLAPI
jgi:hypothetical protein